MLIKSRFIKATLTVLVSCMLVGACLIVTLAWLVLRSSGSQYRISEVGTCVTELNGYYHCAQDRLTPTGVHITLRQCTSGEITDEIQECWTDQPIPEPRKVHSELDGIPTALWVEVHARADHCKDPSRPECNLSYGPYTRATLSYCKAGFKCDGSPTPIRGPAYFVNGVELKGVWDNFDDDAPSYKAAVQKSARSFPFLPAWRTVYVEGREENQILTEEQEAAVRAFCSQGLILFQMPVRGQSDVSLCDPASSVSGEATTAPSSQ